MKKLLNSLLILSSVTTPAVSVVACNTQLKDTKDYEYEIALAINKITYDLNVWINDEQEIIKQQITSSFIKISLEKKLQNKFIDSKLNIGDITYNGHSLIPQDVSQIGQIITLLTLNYGKIKVETKLKLNINDQYQNVVLKAITNADYHYVNNTDSSFEDLKVAMNSDFINSNLDLEIQKKFQVDKFAIKEFLKDNKPLVPEDFKVAGTFFVTIKFQYYNSESNLILKMFLNPTITNQIVNMISNSIYSKSIVVGTTVASLKNDINIDFIKDKLSEALKNQFDNQKWHFINFLNQNNTVLSDRDLLNANSLDVIIQFSYDNMPGKTALKLNITPDINNTILTAIENINLRYFYVTVPYASAETYFTADFIKKQLPEKLQEKFEIDKYKFIKMEWTSMDDGKVYYRYKLNFSYENQNGVVPILQASDVFSRFLVNTPASKLEIKSNSTIKDLIQTFWTTFKKYVWDKTDPQFQNDFELVIDVFQFQLLGFVNASGFELNDNDLVNTGTIAVSSVIMLQNVLTTLPFQILIN